MLGLHINLKLSLYQFDVSLIKRKMLQNTAISSIVVYEKKKSIAQKENENCLIYSINNIF